MKHKHIHCMCSGSSSSTLDTALFLMTPDMTWYEFGTHINRNVLILKVNAWNEKTKWKTFHFWQAVQGWDFLMVDKIIVFLCWLQPETKSYTCHLLNPFNAITTSTSTTGRVKMQRSKLKINWGGGGGGEKKPSLLLTSKQSIEKLPYLQQFIHLSFKWWTKKSKKSKNKHTSFVPWLNICLVDIEVLTITGTGSPNSIMSKHKQILKLKGKQEGG